MTQEQSNAERVKAKAEELKNWFSSIEEAKIEKWKLSVENTQEGIRVDIHAIAFIKHPPKK